MIPGSYKRTNTRTKKEEEEEMIQRKRRRIRFRSLTKNVFLKLCESNEGGDITSVLFDHLDIPTRISLSRVNRYFAFQFASKLSRFDSLEKKALSKRKNLFPIQCLEFSYTGLYLWSVTEQNCFKKMDYNHWKKVISVAFSNPHITSDMIRAILRTCPQDNHKIPHESYEQIVCHNDENFIEWVVKDCLTPKALNKFFCAPTYHIITAFSKKKISCSFLKWYTNNKHNFPVHWLKNQLYASRVFTTLAERGNYKDLLWAISVKPRLLSLTTFTGPEIFIPMLKSNDTFAFASVPPLCFASSKEEMLVFWMTLLAISIKSGHQTLQSVRDDGSIRDKLGGFKYVTTSDDLVHKELSDINIEALYAYDEHHEWWRLPRIVAPYIDAIKYLKRFGKSDEWTLPPPISSIKAMTNEDFHYMYELLHPMFNTMPIS